MVNINKATITKTEVATAATGAGVSQAQLRDMATQLLKLASEMKLGDGQALQELATVVGQAASSLGQSTQSGGGADPLAPRPGATAPPGT